MLQRSGCQVPDKEKSKGLLCQAVLGLNVGYPIFKTLNSGKIISAFLSGKFGMIMSPSQRILIRTNQ